MGTKLRAQQVILSSGGNSVDGNVSYSFGQFSFHYYSEGNSSFAEGVQHPYELYENPFEIPETRTIVDTIIADLDNCIDAMQIIIVAGNGKNVDVLQEASVNFIAGQTIRFLPGFHAHQGSLVQAYITTDGSFCSLGNAGAIVSQPKYIEEKSILIPLTQDNLSEDKSVIVYPNPNNGRFYIQLNHFDSNVKIYIYNTVGSVFYQSERSCNELPQIDLGIIRQGIYFVRVADEKEQFIQKIIVY
jgi:hypothetical protein